LTGFSRAVYNRRDFVTAYYRRRLQVEGVEPSQTRTAPVNAFSLRQFILRFGVYVSLILLMTAAAVFVPAIYSQQSLFLVLRQAALLGLVAIGQTLVLLVAGLDLSVGGVIVVTNVVIAQVSAGQDDRIPLAVGIALVLGALVGLVNGWLITKRNVPPFVATLGVLVFIQGAQVAYTKGIPSGFVPEALNVVNQSVGGLPVPFILWIIFNVIFAVLLYTTPYGRRVYAIGSNREAARLSGIRVDRTVMSIYVLCSLMAVVAGVVLSGYVGYIDRYLGRGFDLDSIAAAVVGGTAFTGGRGSLLGTAAGVLIVQFLSSITLVLGLDVSVQLIVKGLVIVAAVALYSLAARKR
jgi:ribose/xylose/arabinose/galactoside ABC-type transport system permease subunit